MSKKKKIKIGTISKEMMFQAKKERFNPYLSKTGFHGSKKIDRRKQKREDKRELNQY